MLTFILFTTLNIPVKWVLLSSFHSWVKWGLKRKSAHGRTTCLTLGASLPTLLFYCPSLPAQLRGSISSIIKDEQPPWLRARILHIKDTNFQMSIVYVELPIYKDVKVSEDGCQWRSVPRAQARVERGREWAWRGRRRVTCRRTMSGVHRDASTQPGRERA